MQSLFCRLLTSGKAVTVHILQLAHVRGQHVYNQTETVARRRNITKHRLPQMQFYLYLVNENNVEILMLKE